MTEIRVLSLMRWTTISMMVRVYPEDCRGMGVGVERTIDGGGRCRSGLIVIAHGLVLPG